MLPRCNEICATVAEPLFATASFRLGRNALVTRNEPAALTSKSFIKSALETSKRPEPALLMTKSIGSSFSCSAALTIEFSSVTSSETTLKTASSFSYRTTTPSELQHQPP
ncbi:unnamed protein product [Phytophthora fragariaefolia]|uniref:Unnamed protein product n=1 Tax=Phytophthora fragariaefolia TaxID=1490495 RepID=A0A9W6TL67_9STRA|nr:unnamed protein product [Phytophthora fragariaefolia]